MRKLAIGTWCAFGVLGLAGPVLADPEPYETSDFGYEWYEPRLPSGIGVGLILGGGVSGFTDRQMRDNLSSSVLGLWDARVSIGTHVPIGLDLSYVGTAADLTTFDGAANGTLIGTAAEAALRFNLMPHYLVDPYLFAGVGWQHYDVTNMKFATADTGIQRSDDLAEFPMGAGISYRDLSGWMVDVRGTFRAATSSTLVLDPRSGAYADLHSWEASGALGYEF